jgi:hypothetical protein
MIILKRFFSSVSKKMENKSNNFKFVDCDGFGGVEVLKFATKPLSDLAWKTPHSALFQILATGVNRAEIS